MFSLTQQTFRELNPGVGFSEHKEGTALCVRGKIGVESTVTVSELLAQKNQ